MLTSDLWIWIGMTLSLGLWGCCCCCWKASKEGRLPVLALFHVPMSLKKAACGDSGPRSKSMSEEAKNAFYEDMANTNNVFYDRLVAKFQDPLNENRKPVVLNLDS